MYNLIHFYLYNFMEYFNYIDTEIITNQYQKSFK